MLMRLDKLVVPTQNAAASGNLGAIIPGVFAAYMAVVGIDVKRCCATFTILDHPLVLLSCWITCILH